MRICVSCQICESVAYCNNSNQIWLSTGDMWRWGPPRLISERLGPVGTNVRLSTLPESIRILGALYVFTDWSSWVVGAKSRKYYNNHWIYFLIAICFGGCWLTLVSAHPGRPWVPWKLWTSFWASRRTLRAEKQMHRRCFGKSWSGEVCHLQVDL